jgi:DHA2 family multidrug resistance protein
MNRLPLVIVTMGATLLVILDMTIVNVALTDIMAAVGATADQVTWVITAYIVAEAATMPLAAWLAGRFGRRRVLGLSITGFILSSALCGQASGLSELVLFRALQGISGAAVIPLSQSILVSTFPAEQRGRAMAMWGVGVMLGPVLGPTLGGFITEYVGWRWVFYLNVPLGGLLLAMLPTALPASRSEPLALDWRGALMLAGGIATLQFVLDQGNARDWFHSPLIQAAALVSIVLISSYVLRALGRSDNALNIRLLADRNLRAASLMILVFGFGVFGTIALQPILLEQLLGYPAATAGLIMAPRGLAAAAGMLLVARWINALDARWLVATGLLLAAASSWVLSHVSPVTDAAFFITSSMVQGLGMSFVFVPLSTLAYQTLARSASDQAAVLYNVARTVGSSLGISLASYLVSLGSRIRYETLVQHVTPYNPAWQDWAAQHGGRIDDPQILASAAQEITRQANLIGFVDAFHSVALSFVLLMPLLLLFGRNQARTQSTK